MNAPALKRGVLRNLTIRRLDDPPEVSCTGDARLPCGYRVAYETTYEFAAKSGPWLVRELVCRLHAADFIQAQLGVRLSSEDLRAERAAMISTLTTTLQRLTAAQQESAC